MRPPAWKPVVDDWCSICSAKFKASSTLNPEISDGAFQLGVTEEKLDRTQVSGLTIDLGSLRTAHRVRAV
jgi:hypothetical protein